MDIGTGGEFDVPIGAVVEFSDQGQIKLIDDEGEVKTTIIIIIATTIILRSDGGAIQYQYFDTTSETSGIEYCPSIDTDHHASI